MSRLFYENKKSKFYKTKMFAPLVQGPGYAIESLYTIYTWLVSVSIQWKIPHISAWYQSKRYESSLNLALPRFFTLMDHYTLCTHSSQIPPISTHKFSFHHLIFSFLLQRVSTVMRYAFIQKGYSSILGIVWIVNGHGATLQICTFILGVRLIIKVSFALEMNKPYPNVLPPPSFSHPPSIFLYHKLYRWM